MEREIKFRGHTKVVANGFMGNDLFPEVTFENSPQEVEIKIKTK